MTVLYNTYTHAGAGSILEALSLQKPLVVVINDQLMNNHQTELARQLHKDGHLLYTTPRYTTACQKINELGCICIKILVVGHNTPFYYTHGATYRVFHLTPRSSGYSAGEVPVVLCAWSACTCSQLESCLPVEDCFHYM